MNEQMKYELSVLVAFTLCGLLVILNHYLLNRPEIPIMAVINYLMILFIPEQKEAKEDE